MSHTVRTTMKPDVDLVVDDKELENLRLLGVLVPAPPEPEPAAQAAAAPAAPADEKASLEKDTARGRRGAAAS